MNKLELIMGLIVVLIKLLKNIISVSKKPYFGLIIVVLLFPNITPEQALKLVEKLEKMRK